MNKPQEKIIYLDHNATTPVDPEAVSTMMPYLKKDFGNPSSGYALGAEARAGVERARSEVAALLGCDAEEIIFTSGGSESNNMVLKGLVDFRQPEESHIITCSVEHPAILNPAFYLKTLGVGLAVLPVDRFGRVAPEALEKAILPRTTLITIMLANNETGTLQEVEKVSEIGRRFGIAVHTDAAQAVGKIALNVRELGVDFLTVAGHKLYGPKGVGALYVRGGRKITPLIHGAGQESGLRAGTENVILATGLGAACRVALERIGKDVTHMSLMRDRLQERLFDGLDGIVLNGHPEYRLPNTLNVSVPGLEGAQILAGLPHIAASTGAACHDRTVKLSHVLDAMGVHPDVGMGALRLTVGRGSSLEDMDEAARSIISRVKAMGYGAR